MKTFSISTDCHIKTCRSLRSDGGLFWKSLVAFFRRTYALSVGFKMKRLRKSAFQCYKTKTSPSFAVKPVKRYRHLFLLSIAWITFFKHLYSLIRDNRVYIKLNWLCKHTKNDSQAVIIILNWAKHSFSLLISLRILTGKYTLK